MKKLLLIFLIAFILHCIFSMITGNVFVVKNSKYSPPPRTAVPKPGDVVKPFERFDFTEGEWKAYLVIDDDDYDDLDTSIPKKSVLKTSDSSVLNEMKHWAFKITGGDMTTVQSYLVVFHNGKLVFDSGIVLGTSGIGLQGEYGWVFPIDDKETILKTIRKFKTVYWPVVIL